MLCFVVLNRTYARKYVNIPWTTSFGRTVLSKCCTVIVIACAWKNLQLISLWKLPDYEYQILDNSFHKVFEFFTLGPFIGETSERDFEQNFLCMQIPIGTIRTIDVHIIYLFMILSTQNKIIVDLFLSCFWNAPSLNIRDFDEHRYVKGQIS